MRFEQLMTERNNVFRKHPKTTFVAAHMGWHANDLGRLGKLFDAISRLIRWLDLHNLLGIATLVSPKVERRPS